MATNFNGLRGTAETLDAIVAKVNGLTLADSRKAFETVELFDAVDLEDALKSFIYAKDRVAIVVFDSDSFENEPEAQTQGLRSAQTRRVDLLVSDRVIDHDRRKALFGFGDHPGAFALADVAILGLSGSLFENPKGIFLRPLGSASLQVSDAKQKETPGRRGRVVHFEARGGLITRDLGKGAIQ
jgi:hypothetical protein